MTHTAPETERVPGPATDETGRLKLPPPAAPTVSEAETRTQLGTLSAFHRGDPEAAAALEPPGVDHVPALLHPFRDPTRVRNDYPLFLATPESPDDDPVCIPVGPLLRDTAERIAPAEDDARILKDNLDRLECRLRETLAGNDAPVDATGAFEAAGAAMIDELALGPASADHLHDDLRRLLEALPPRGRVAALSDDAPLHVFVAAARQRARSRRATLRRMVAEAEATLRDLLRLDRSKTPEAGAPAALSDAIGGAASHVDAEMLARVLGSVRGQTSMDPGLRQIVEDSLAALRAFLARVEPPLVTVVGRARPPHCATDEATDGEIAWRELFGEAACRVASNVFDAQAAEYESLFAAVRVARLLAAGTADPDRLAAMRAAFDWRSFSAEELLALPPIVALESATDLAGGGMAECSRLLRSGRPVEIVVPVSPATDPGAAPGASAGYRFELAYLGISHREALVHQSSAARPEHLMVGFLRSLDAATGSLHVITSGLTADGGEPGLGAWLHAGAALDSRAHPFLHYDPEAGATWARRFELDGNPQPEADWPEYELTAIDDDDEAHTFAVAFTFADFVLLEPRYRDHYRVIPPSVPAEKLTALAAHLAAAPEETPDRLPFIWSADGKGHAHRLLVDRMLVRACRDRLDYWRTLQELAGIRNEHVREAVERERERLETAFATEHDQLIADHAATLAQVRRDEARAALERLAQSLLGVDPSSLAATVLTPPTPPTAPSAAPAEPSPTPAPAEAAPDPAAAPDVDADEEPEEPWIQGVLCTSCNDCLDINPQLFIYNANKQAVIGDAQAGTFAQLVQAAEKCPARCIHPGQPLDPDEPDLDALRERARPFNT